MFQWFTPKQSFCMRRAVAISHVLSIKGISFHSWAKTRWWPENKLNLAGFQSHFFKDVFFKDGHHNLHKPSELFAWSLGIGQKLNHWFQTSMLDPKIVNPRATVQLVDRFLTTSMEADFSSFAGVFDYHLFLSQPFGNSVLHNLVNAPMT